MKNFAFIIIADLSGTKLQGKDLYVQCVPFTLEISHEKDNIRQLQIDFLSFTAVIPPQSAISYGIYLSVFLAFSKRKKPQKQQILFCICKYSFVKYINSLHGIIACNVVFPLKPAKLPTLYLPLFGSNFLGCAKSFQWPPILIG